MIVINIIMLKVYDMRKAFYLFNYLNLILYCAMQTLLYLVVLIALAVKIYFLSDLATVIVTIIVVSIFLVLFFVGK